MAEIVEMPKLSDTMTVGTLVKWLRKEGDTVKTGDMLAEVETDKATMELECFFDGTLLKIYTPAGSQVPIGAALCAVGKPGEAPPAPKPVAAAPALRAQQAPAPAKRPAAEPRPAEARGAEAGAPAPDAGRIRISPLARKLAAAKGIDPAALAGTGPRGRIVRADVLAAEKALLPTPGVIQENRLDPVSNMRATVARRLVESKSQIPHFYAEIEVDAAPLLEMRAALNKSLEAEGVKLSVNDFILKASADALRRVPAVNCSWEGNAIRRHGAAHVSFAVAMEDGLITPVVRDVESKSLKAIGVEAKALATRAKEKKLAPADFAGGTFCVSNMGMLGVERFSAIINPPNAAILAVGATVSKPVVRDGRIEIGQRMSLTLSCDHRVVDGATGAAFLAALKALLEKPALLVL